MAWFSRTSALLLLLAAPALAQDPPTAAMVERAHQLLKGKWQIESITEDGETLGQTMIRDRLARNGQIEFANRTLIVVDPRTGDKSVTPVRINPAAQPRQIDLTTRDDRQIEGIYMINEDDLTVCLDMNPGPNRPGIFDSTAGSGKMLVKLKLIPSTQADTPPAGELLSLRIEETVAKPAATEPQPLPTLDQPLPAAASPTPLVRTPTPDEIQSAHNLLTGNWDILEVIDDGETLGPELIRQRIAEDGRVRFTHQAASVTTPTTELQRSIHFRLNPATVPSQIDVTTSFDTLLKGIYRFDGDTLTVCVSKQPSGDRPTDFTATTGSDRRLYRLKVAPPDAPLPPPGPSPDEIAREREETIKRMLVGIWALQDSRGVLSATLKSNGQFAATREWNKQSRRLFSSRTDTSQGNWSFQNSRLTAQVSATTDKQVAGRLFSLRVITISPDQMELADALGGRMILRKLR